MSDEDLKDAISEVKAEDERERKALPKNSKRRVPGDERLSDALSALAASLDPDKVAQANRKANFPSNRAAPLVSSLNPQGDKDFKRPTTPYNKIRIPYEAEEEDFTFEELELLNLLEPGEYRILMNDNSPVTMQVVVHRNEHTQKPEILELVSALGFAPERRHGLPPFSNILRQILGDKARPIATMEERRRWVEQKKVPVSVGA